MAAGKDKDGPTLEHLLVLLERMLRQQSRLLRRVAKQQRELHDEFEDDDDD